MSLDKDITNESSLSYRNPLPSDCSTVFQWINDELTRANSFTKEPISFKEHQDWFNNRIQDKDGLYVLFFENENQDKPVGQLRVDFRAEGAVVSILTAPESRGRGYALQMLRELQRLHAGGYFGRQPLRAWVMDHNIPSSRAFISAGFEPALKETVKGIPSTLYLLKFQQ